MWDLTVMKPLAVAAMFLTALAGFFHYVTIGPHEADDDDAERHKHD
jgi:formate dehydrogenase iron-sulfur subunit